MCESCTTNQSKILRNPLKSDPTRTSQLRLRFEQLLRGKFNRLKRDIRRLLVDEDAFGIKRKPSVFNQTANQRFEFQTSSEQIAAFEAWLKQQVDDGILDGKTATDKADGYWKAFSEDAYRRGAGRAFNDVRKPALSTGEDVSDFFEGTRDEFLRQSFARPVAIDKLKVLAGRVFTDLQGVTVAMSTQLVRQLTDGLARGEGPSVIAKELTETIDKIGARRATMIARTEIIRAHAEAQLDAMESLGVTEVGVMVEWSTAGDDRVCPLCQPLEGVVMTIKEARGLIPRHPQCRCNYTPANVGEPKNDKSVVHFTNPDTGKVERKVIPQKRTQTQLKRAQSQSIKAEIPKSSKRTIAQQKQISTWKGADMTVKKKRPVAVVKAGPEQAAKPLRKPKRAKQPTPKPTKKTTPKATPERKPKVTSRAKKQPIQPASLQTAKEATQDYTTDAFQRVNTGLREGKVVDKRIVEGTDKYLKASPKSAGNTVRSFSATEQQKQEILAELKTGTFTDKAFVSTRKNPTLTDRISLETGSAPSGRVVLRVNGKTGVDISDISLNPGEGEVLYPRNTTFRVVGITETPQGGVIADLEEIAK